MNNFWDTLFSSRTVAFLNATAAAIAFFTSQIGTDYITPKTTVLILGATNTIAFFTRQLQTTNVVSSTTVTVVKEEPKEERQSHEKSESGESR